MAFQEIINPREIENILDQNNSSSEQEVIAVVEKTRRGRELSLEDTAIILNAPSGLIPHIIEAAKEVNLRIHGKVITFYGVCYISDECINACRYCGNSVHSNVQNWKRTERCTLTPEEFKKDLSALLAEHDFKEVCFLTGEYPKAFNTDDLIAYMQIASEMYNKKIILNIPPKTVEEFRRIKAAIPNRLHFRVFQETYDPRIYSREHPRGPKANFEKRLSSQSLALEAGFDEVGLGALFGLNDGIFGSRYEIMGLKMHSDYLVTTFGVYPMSISFPRVRVAEGVNYKIPQPVEDEEFIKLIAVTRLAIPQTNLIITCRETAEFRYKIRPIINIEDFGAKPGPMGNCENNVHFQMELPDRRSGEDIKQEIEEQGYEVR
jgi:2-iminoacetate synthase